jgi:hypothetical protein
MSLCLCFPLNRLDFICPPASVSNSFQDYPTRVATRFSRRETIRPHSLNLYNLIKMRLHKKYTRAKHFSSGPEFFPPDWQHWNLKGPQNHRVHRGRDEIGGCVSALSAGAYTATLYVMVKIVKGGGSVPPYPHQPGLIVTSWWNVCSKAAAATLSKLCAQICGLLPRCRPHVLLQEEC